MLFAERQGKLGRDSSRAHDRAEDLLTSTAFQLLRYIPARDGLLAILNKVRRVHWEAGRAIVTVDRPKWLPSDQADAYDLEFWPYWRGAGVPDVVLRLSSRERLIAEIVIEVKLDSPKSLRGDGELAEDDAEEEPRRPDQLWDYFDYVKRQRDDLAAGLVYLTSQTNPPEQELVESLECCASARSANWLGWLSWRDVWAAMRDAAAAYLPARDLADILAAKGLRAFDGFHTEAWSPPPRPWQFFRPWFGQITTWSPPSGLPSFWLGGRVKK